MLFLLSFFGLVELFVLVIRFIFVIRLVFVIRFIFAIRLVLVTLLAFIDPFYPFCCQSAIIACNKKRACNGKKEVYSFTTPMPGRSGRVILPSTTVMPLKRSLAMRRLPSRSAKSTTGEN